MIHAVQQKLVFIIPPQAIVDATSWTTAEIDVKGFDWATIYFALGALDIAISALELTESDTTGSGHAAISGTDFDGDTDIAGATATLPSATDDDKVWAWDLDLGRRKRFLDMTATIGDGSAGGYAVAWAELSRGENPTVLAADRGLEAVLRP